MTSLPTALATGRRALLTSGLAGGAVVATGLTESAEAAGDYKAATYAVEPLLRGRDRHLVSRFSYGITPELAKDVRRRGGADAWFEWQLEPDGIPDRHTQSLHRWWPYLAKGPKALWQANVMGKKGGWEVMADYQRWVLMRRMTSDRDGRLTPRRVRGRGSPFC